MNRHRGSTGRAGAAHVRNRATPGSAVLTPMVIPTMSAPPQPTGSAMTLAQRLAAERQIAQIRHAAIREVPVFRPMFTRDVLLDDGTRPALSGSKHARYDRSHKGLRVLALGLVGVLAFASAAVGSTANRFTGNLISVDLDKLMQHERPLAATAEEIAAASAALRVSAGESGGLADDDLSQPVAELVPQIPATTPGAPINILVMGTDSRGGENAALGGGQDTGARSDSTLLLHISGDRQWISGVSIPRDTIVNIPACPTTSGKYIGAHPLTRFNAAFAYGAKAGKDVASGALCTLTTVEKITGIRMDGFIVLDFNGFKNMVEALGGLELCIPNAIKAPKAEGLSLAAGCHHLNGFETLQLSRARVGQGLGDGSDLARITRQQNIMQAMANQALRNGFLSDPLVMLRFLDATTTSLTTSSNYASVNGLLELASALGDIDSSSITFLTAPIYTNPENPNTVLLAPRAKTLWENIRFDQKPEIK